MNQRMKEKLKTIAEKKLPNRVTATLFDISLAEFLLVLEEVVRTGVVTDEQGIILDRWNDNLTSYIK